MDKAIMPRRLRLQFPGIAMHVIQRGNNRGNCFFNDRDRKLYLEWLQQYCEDFACHMHAYVLMNNHVHFLVTPSAHTSMARMMKGIDQRYAQYANRYYDRTGAFWEGRYFSCPVQGEAYLLRCHRYIELNPVRAGLVRHPRDFEWSSYAANAHGGHSKLITHHEIYSALGTSKQTRLANYRELFQTQLTIEQLTEIRTATNSNRALGDHAFQEWLAALLGRRVSTGKPGRPPKSVPALQ